MDNHVHIPKNEHGIDYIIGDLHGCRDTLDLALRIIGFNYGKDRLFSVGDLVDRGRQNEECADLIAQPWFFGVRGNHEQMAIDYFDGIGDHTMYYHNGGKWFIDLTPSLQKHYADEFRKLPIMMTVDNTYGIIHADVPCDDWERLITLIEPASPSDFCGIIQSCIWGRDKIKYNDPTVIKNIDTIYCGHTPVREPVVLGNCHYIDTGCVFEKYLTIMSLDGVLKFKIPLVKE